MKIARALGHYVSPALKGWARYVRGSYKDFYPFGSAMNGQTARLEAVRQIIHACKIEFILETGTFRGTTTEWLAGFGAPVISIEVHVPSYEFSRRRLAKFKNVAVKLGNSVDVLRSVLPEFKQDVRTLVYLDAHWENYLPLKEEINLVTSHFRNFVIVIDDFQVPADPGYTFDDYGAGKALTEEYLETCRNPRLTKFYPAGPSMEETGMRRGWIVLTADSGLAATLNNIVLLKRAA